MFQHRLRRVAVGLVLILPTVAQAVPFHPPAQVERVELSGALSFVDEFDDGVFPGGSWLVTCGAASESGGALSVDDASPGAVCSDPLFVAGLVFGSRRSPYTLTVDFQAVLPGEGDTFAIAIGTFDLGDFIAFGVRRIGGQIFLGTQDETGLQPFSLVDAADLPVSDYTLEIALALDGPSGIFVPTVSATSDGSPIFAQTLDPSLGLDPNGSAGSGVFLPGLTFAVPAPGIAMLLLHALALPVIARRARSAAPRR